MFLILQLVPRVLRATPWVGFVPAGVIALALGWVATRQPLSLEHRLLPTRLAVLAVAIAVGFVFDDLAAPLSDPLPSQLRWRRLIRSLFALVLAAALLSSLLPLAAKDMDIVRVIGAHESLLDEPAEEVGQETPRFPGGRVALEAGTMIGFTLAAAAFVARRGEREPGRTATAVLLGAYAVSWMIPDSHKPWASPSDQRWDTGAPWWWVALVVVWPLVCWLSWDSRVAFWPARLRRAPSPPPDSELVPYSTQSGK